MILAEDGSYAFTESTPGEPGVALWTVRRLPFETDQDQAQRKMVRRLAPVIRAISYTPGQLLRGMFVSSERSGRQPDAENIVYYNFRGGDRDAGGASPFALTPPGVVFERSFLAPPVCPAELSATPSYFHSWEPTVSGEPSGWEVPMGDAEISEWTGVRCELVHGDDAGRHVWLAMCEQMAADTGRVVAHRLLNERRPELGIEVTLRVPADARINPVDALKGCVDGAIASFQRFRSDERDLAVKVMTKHAAWPRWRCQVSPGELIKHAIRDDGTTALPGAPFNLNGLNPCDDRLVAGSLSVIEDARVQLPELDGRIFVVRVHRAASQQDFAERFQEETHGAR